MIDTITIQSVPLKFRLDDTDDMKAFDLITEMYTAREHPYIVSIRDGCKFLIIPPSLVKVFPVPNANQIPAEAPAALRLSNGAGASNG